MPNVKYEPAANNAYDAGVNSNHSTSSGNGGAGAYYDADPVPRAADGTYADASGSAA